MTGQQIPHGPEWQAFLAEKLGTDKWAIATGRRAQRLLDEGKATLTIGPSYYRRLQAEYLASKQA